MPRYRVTTPDTPRAPCTCCADFQQATEVESVLCIRHLLEYHNFAGCTVHRKRRGNHWELIFDSSTLPQSPWLQGLWKRVEGAQ